MLQAEYEITTADRQIPRRSFLGAIAALPLLAIAGAAIAQQPGPADYIDGMLALGWLPYLVVHRDGSTSLYERHPDRHEPEAMVRGRLLSAYWMQTDARSAAVRSAMIERGLVVRAWESEGGRRHAA